MSLLHFTTLAAAPNSPPTASMTVSLSSNCSVPDNTSKQPQLGASLEEATSAINVSSSTESQKCSRSSSRGAPVQPSAVRTGIAKLVPLCIQNVRSASTSHLSEGAYVSPSRHYPIPLVNTPNRRAGPASFVVRPHPLLPPDQVRALQCGSPSASLYPRGRQMEASVPHIATPIARLGGFSRQMGSAPLAQGSSTFRPSRDGARAAHSCRVPVACANTATFAGVHPSLQEHTSL